MTGLRKESGVFRAAAGILLALLLALRLLSPDGFMPAFDGGSVTIIVCPDFDSGQVPLAHHHGSKFKAHCPYAASGGSATAALPSLLAAMLAFAAVPFLGRTYRFLERQRARVRPPSQAPPLPARA